MENLSSGPTRKSDNKNDQIINELQLAIQQDRVPSSRTSGENNLEELKKKFDKYLVYDYLGINMATFALSQLLIEKGWDSTCQLDEMKISKKGISLNIKTKLFQNVGRGDSLVPYTDIKFEFRDPHSQNKFIVLRNRKQNILDDLDPISCLNNFLDGLVSVIADIGNEPLQDIDSLRIKNKKWDKRNLTLTPKSKYGQKKKLGMLKTNNRFFSLPVKGLTVGPEKNVLYFLLENQKNI